MSTSKWTIMMACALVLVVLAKSSPADDGISAWRYTASMQHSRIEAPVVICGDYVFIFGGHGAWATEPYSTVERAPITAGGNLGAWILESDTLPIPVYGAAAISKDSMIYVIGGNVPPTQPTTVVQYTRLNPDGTLQPWAQTSPLLQQRVNCAAAEYGGRIYVVGGNPSKRLTSAEYTQINPDGTLSDWSYTSSMNLTRWLPSACAHDGYVYAVGGFNGGPTATVEYAAINPDGSLATWTYTSTMNVPRSGVPAVAILNGYLYVTAGDNYSSTLHKSVERALINPDGSLSEWVMESDTLPNRIHLCGSAQQGSNVYVVGGENLVGTSIDDVVMSSSGFAHVCGDCDCSQIVNVSDAVYLITYIFGGGPEPCAECP